MWAWSQLKRKILNLLSIFDDLFIILVVQNGLYRGELKERYSSGLFSQSVLRPVDNWLDGEYSVLHCKTHKNTQVKNISKRIAARSITVTGTFSIYVMLKSKLKKKVNWLVRLQITKKNSEYTKIENVLLIDNLFF